MVPYKWFKMIFIVKKLFYGFAILSPISWTFGKGNLLE